VGNRFKPLRLSFYFGQLLLSPGAVGRLHDRLGSAFTALSEMCSNTFRILSVGARHLNLAVYHILNRHVQGLQDADAVGWPRSKGG